MSLAVVWVDADRSEPLPGPSAAGNLQLLQPPAAPMAPTLPMSPNPPRQYAIQGLTRQGRAFRPSDWAERLAGAMSCFRPGGNQGGIGAFIGYSPYCVPRLIDGVKCVVVNEALRDIEPMAWDFVMSFARDNELTVVDHPRPGHSATGPVRPVVP